MPFTTQLEHWQKAVRTMRTCFATALDTQMKHGSVKAKVFLLTIFMKMISDAKSFIWNFFGNLVNKADGTVKDFNSAYCNNCLWSSEIGPKKAYKNIVSMKNLSQHFECLVKMRATSITLFVRVNSGVTENAGMENARRSKSGIGKP